MLVKCNGGSHFDMRACAHYIFTEKNLKWQWCFPVCMARDHIREIVISRNTLHFNFMTSAMSQFFKKLRCTVSPNVPFKEVHRQLALEGKMAIIIVGILLSSKYSA